LAEDREDDILLIRRAFEKAGILNPLFIVRDGEKAMSYLEGKDRFSNREQFPLPGLLLLDLKMPKVDGFEVLSWLRGAELASTTLHFEFAARRGLDFFPQNSTPEPRLPSGRKFFHGKADGLSERSAIGPGVPKLLLAEQ